jgi:hypothetical protein
MEATATRKRTSTGDALDASQIAKVTCLFCSLQTECASVCACLEFPPPECSIGSLAMTFVQAIEDHLDSQDCSVCSSGSGIKQLLDSPEQLVGLAASLFVYAKGKQALAQPLQVGAVPADYVKLAKNCIAATFAASHLSSKGETRYEIGGQIFT